MKDQRAQYAEVARAAAEHILGEAPSAFTPQRMTKYAHWFTDASDTALIAVVTPGEKVTAADEVLAYALAWQGDRDLHLVLPDELIAVTETRVAWLQTHVQMWHYAGAGAPDAIVTPSRPELFERLRSLRHRASRSTSLTDEHSSWIDSIDTAGLAENNRSYLSWHHEGLQVLKVSTRRGGLRVQAGVQYKTAPAGREPFDKTFNKTPTAGEIAVINAKIRLAMEDQGSQTSQMREHKLQADLKGAASTFGLTHLWREFPAWRGLIASAPQVVGRAGYIDFLGADAQGGLHVVETKIGHDPRVVLQALDYAIWVAANDDLVRTTLAANGHVIERPHSKRASTAPATLHLVLGRTKGGTAFSPYLAGQIEAIAGDVDVRIHLIKDLKTPLDIVTLPKRQMWHPTGLVSAAVTGPRWPERLTTGLAGDQQ
ncbi:hypothetical protein RDV89_00900 [Nocardioides zeae]|uniref:DUF4263 domain-containing protein n=1 Tax=Nocardioides imazamoxiresistens TaxID=3231893 RepID=A0ABU3PQV3_9ACTN|nr:hypothetical protein [Nocardioides zeae]MDT9591604.1 hypothetical protein [Nocardioides zeae]